jgi:hypothetical protein
LVRRAGVPTLDQPCADCLKESAPLMRPSPASRRAVAFWIVTYLFTTLMLGTTLPTPLYVIYQAQWHFSSGITTVIFASYAVGVLAALLLAGRSSDQEAGGPCCWRRSLSGRSAPSCSSCRPGFLCRSWSQSTAEFRMLSAVNIAEDAAPVPAPPGETALAGLPDPRTDHPQRDPCRLSSPPRRRSRRQAGGSAAAKRRSAPRPRPPESLSS